MTTRKLTCLLLLLCWMLPHLLMSNRWVHGSLYLPVFQEGYEISQFSGHPLSIEEEAAVLPASIRIIGKAQEGLLLAGSNGLRLRFRGPGSLAFERFEQQVSGNRLAGKSKTPCKKDPTKKASAPIKDREIKKRCVGMTNRFRVRPEYFW